MRKLAAFGLALATTFALARLINDRSYRDSFMDHGRAYVQENFSVQRLVQNIEDLYLSES